MLQTITKGVVEKPPRILTYGEQKIGKTTFASQFPEPILIQLAGEEGADEIDISKFPIIKDFETFKQALTALCQEDHKFQTLIIDSISALEPLIWHHICTRDGKENIEDFGFGRGYSLANNEIFHIFPMLDYLRNEKMMTVIIIGHAKIINFSDPSGDTFTKYDLDCHKAMMQTIQRWADAVYFAKFAVATRTEEKGFGAKEKKAVMTTRVLCCQSNGSYTAGGRGKYGRLPDQIDLSYEAFTKALKEVK